jgi:lambda family phage holin
VAHIKGTKMENGFKDLLNGNPWLGGVLMAGVMSTLRIIYDREETHWLRIVMEGIICGGLTVAAGSALVAMGYDQGWYLFCGGAIGFMGSQSVRALAYKLIKKKTDY